jgi:hypothetical protein
MSYEVPKCQKGSKIHDITESSRSCLMGCCQVKRDGPTVRCWPFFCYFIDLKLMKAKDTCVVWRKRPTCSGSTLCKAWARESGLWRDLTHKDCSNFLSINKVPFQTCWDCMQLFLNKKCSFPKTWHKTGSEMNQHPHEVLIGILNR